MKPIVISMFLLLSMAVKGQDVVTTTEEYNYLTKGLKRTLEEGADAKVGYTLEENEPVTHPNGNYTFTFRPFKKNDSGKIVAISVFAQSKLWNHTYYLCIPRGNPQLTQLYWAELEKWDLGIIKAYTQYVSLMMAEALGQVESK